MESIFMDKAVVATEDDLMEKLGKTNAYWQKLKSYLFDSLKDPSEGWNFPGKKYSLSFRIKSKKRNIILLSTQEWFFKVVFIFGKKLQIRF